MAQEPRRQRTIVVGAGPVGALAALYAAQRGHHVEVYELRGGTSRLSVFACWFTREYHLRDCWRSFPK